MKLKSLFSRQRICGRCGKPIAKVHRWHLRRLRILFWTLAWPEHRDCYQPHLNPHNRYSLKRLKNEVPLPFAEEEYFYEEKPLNTEPFHPHTSSTFAAWRPPEPKA